MGMLFVALDALSLFIVFFVLLSAGSSIGLFSSFLDLLLFVAGMSTSSRLFADQAFNWRNPSRGGWRESELNCLAIFVPWGPI